MNLVFAAVCLFYEKYFSENLGPSGEILEYFYNASALRWLD